MIEIGIHPLLISIILMLHHQHSMQKTLHICATLYAICISAWPSGRFMRGENLLQVMWGLQAPTYCGRPSSIFFPLHFNKLKRAQCHIDSRIVGIFWASIAYRPHHVRTFNHLFAFQQLERYTITEKCSLSVILTNATQCLHYWRRWADFYSFSMCLSKS